MKTIHELVVQGKSIRNYSGTLESIAPLHRRDESEVNAI